MKVYPDISHHHPVTDWDALEDNCPFLISKATEGTSYVDPTLSEFIQQCERREIPYWLYTYLRKGGESAQAKYLVSTCKRQVEKYFCGYILDVEAGNSAADVRAALQYLEGLGGKVMIYTMYAQYDTYKSVIQDRSGNTAWWEARYGANDGTYSKKYPPHNGVDLHQYTSVGRVNGLTGNIDLNRITGSKPGSWFTTPAGKAAPKKTEKHGYSGTFPALPPRGYYQMGDGITALTNYPTQIKRVQKLINWITGAGIAVDGKYGGNTVAAVKSAQRNLGITPDGKFGEKTLAAAKRYEK